MTRNAPEKQSQFLRGSAGSDRQSPSSGRPVYNKPNSPTGRDRIACEVAHEGVAGLLRQTNPTSRSRRANCVPVRPERLTRHYEPSGCAKQPICGTAVDREAFYPLGPLQQADRRATMSRAGWRRDISRRPVETRGMRGSDGSKDSDVLWWSFRRAASCRAEPRRFPPATRRRPGWRKRIGMTRTAGSSCTPRGRRLSGDFSGAT